MRADVGQSSYDLILKGFALSMEIIEYELVKAVWREVLTAEKV